MASDETPTPLQPMSVSTQPPLQDGGEYHSTRRFPIIINTEPFTARVLLAHVSAHLEMARLRQQVARREQEHAAAGAEP